MSSAAPLIEPLDRRHEVQAFDCGQVALNDYLRRQATQDVRRDVNRVFVARIESSPDVIGYYSLSAASFGKRDLPADLARRLPHYPVPAALLGRLAVDKQNQFQPAKAQGQSRGRAGWKPALPATSLGIVRAATQRPRGEPGSSRGRNSSGYATVRASA